MVKRFMYVKEKKIATKYLNKKWNGKPSYFDIDKQLLQNYLCLGIFLAVFFNEWILVNYLYEITPFNQFYEHEKLSEISDKSFKL